MRNFGKLAYSRSRRIVRRAKTHGLSFINTRFGIGIVLGAIVGSLALLIVLIMGEDGDRAHADINKEIRVPRARNSSIHDPFHPVIPTPTPPPGSYLNK